MIEPIFLTTKKDHKIRILAPNDFDGIDRQIDKPYLKTIFHVSFYSGMRYAEVQRLHERPELWLKERKTLFLPKEVDRKVKRQAPERYITPIPPQLEAELPYFFMNKKPPCLKVWDENLKRWAKKAGLGEIGISAKMTRASIESWLVMANIFNVAEVCLRQGHTETTQLRHYLALPFTDAEKAEIRKRCSGWN